MKSTELRIGNWYHFADNDGIVYRCVKEIKQNEFGLFGDYDGVNFGICQPIPLTEEWLLRFGFEYSTFYSNYKIKAGDYWNSMQFYKGEWNYNSDDSDAACYYLTTIKHVHQLQNLYFALTGEELTLKNEER